MVFMDIKTFIPFSCTSYVPGCLNKDYGMESSLTTLLRRGGYGKLVQKELESRRQLVDYEAPVGGLGSLPSYQQQSNSTGGGAQGGYGGGGGFRNRGNYKRHREEERAPADGVKRIDRGPRPEKNPRFREKGDSDDEDGGKN
ncbi:hypothetical protein Mapa_005511 [Marchantia paleacea]|nr:hypothetical protein Mapa_005511 [Marchantia paleacea]